MLFWLGSIEFETPRGRFILTGASEVYVSRRRSATKEEAAHVLIFLETWLNSASYNELLPLYELYQELTSEPFNGPSGEPHVPCVLHAIESALWSKQLHLQVEEPYDPLPELEWEPPPLQNLPKRSLALSPSELWGRRDSAPNVTRATPTASEEKEYTVKVVDEQSKPLSGISMSFRHGSESDLVPTDGDGIAKFTTSDTDSVTVTFASPSDLATLMQPIWTESRGVERKDWVQANATTTTVSLFGGNIVKALADKSTTATTQPTENIEPFFGVQPPSMKPGQEPDKPTTLNVQPLVIMVRMLGEHFDTDKCFVLPKALDNVKDLVKLHKEYALTDLLIVGHTDTAGKDDYNLDLSLERTSAMRAYLTDDADSWYAWYSDSKKDSKRWGTTEDSYMIQSLLGDPGCPPAPDGNPYSQTVLGYQQWHNAAAPQKDGYDKLKEDGKIGPNTRKQLILDYMHRDGTSVPEGTDIQVHGCGEYFPLDASGENLDTNTADGQHEQEDRRVEVFLFPKELGLLPPVPGQKATKGEPEYAEWRRRSIDFELLGVANVILWIEGEPMAQVTDGDAPAGSDDRGPENANVQV